MHELKGYFLVYNPNDVKVFYAKTKPNLYSFIEKNNITSSNIVSIFRGKKLNLEVTEKLRIK